jgi:hypothetical protein
MDGFAIRNFGRVRIGNENKNAPERITLRRVLKFQSELLRGFYLLERRLRDLPEQARVVRVVRVELR